MFDLHLLGIIAVLVLTLVLIQARRNSAARRLKQRVVDAQTKATRARYRQTGTSWTQVLGSDAKHIAKV